MTKRRIVLAAVMSIIGWYSFPLFYAPYLGHTANFLDAWKYSAGTLGMAFYLIIVWDQQ